MLSINIEAEQGEPWSLSFLAFQINSREMEARRRDLFPGSLEWRSMLYNLRKIASHEEYSLLVSCTDIYNISQCLGLVRIKPRTQQRCGENLKDNEKSSWFCSLWEIKEFSIFIFKTEKGNMYPQLQASNKLPLLLFNNYSKSERQSQLYIDIILKSCFSYFL